MWRTAKDQRYQEGLAMIRLTLFLVCVRLARAWIGSASPSTVNGSINFWNSLRPWHHRSSTHLYERNDALSRSITTRGRSVSRRWNQRATSDRPSSSSSSRLPMSLRAAAKPINPLASLQRSIRKSYTVLDAYGRAPTAPDKLDQYSPDDVEVPTKPADPSEARLIILQVTDVYTLENFASFKTLLEATRHQSEGCQVVSMLTGDFLSPYLLSSIDRGVGMMNALNKIPMDYLTWGNHEADIDHRTVCKHVRNFKGKWINTNMLDHEAMDAQQEYDIIEITSPDGSNTRKVGLVAVMSDDPNLYKHFKAPGAFGGATITDPWDALRKYQELLQSPEHNCDLIIPLQHTYVPDDHKTCKDFDFPVILSGHDHHKVDEVVCGTRLLKPGMNAEYATLLEVSWKDASAEKPKIRARFVKCDDFPPDPLLREENERAYDALMPLRNTELARVPPTFQPLTSNGSRECVCSMGRFICTLIKSSMNVTRRQRHHKVDAVMLMGGNIRGNQDYPLGSFFSLEALEAEIKSDEVIAVVPIPGKVLAEGIEATHAGDPIPGWMQYDQGIIEDTSVHPPRVTHVGGEPLDPDRIYNVATKISDLTNGQSPPLTKYFKENQEVLPAKGNYVNIHAELMGYFARNLFRKLWDAITANLDETTCDVDDDCNADERLAALDSDGDGIVTVDEVHEALRDLLGLSVDDREKTLAHFVHNFADATGDGRVTRNDIRIFCNEIAAMYENDKWRLAHPRSFNPERVLEQIHAEQQQPVEIRDLSLEGVNEKSTVAGSTQ